MDEWRDCLRNSLILFNKVIAIFRGNTVEWKNKNTTINENVKEKGLKNSSNQ
jgi:hypothetical protein